MVPSVEGGGGGGGGMNLVALFRRPKGLCLKGGFGGRSYCYKESIVKKCVY